MSVISAINFILLSPTSDCRSSVVWLPYENLESFDFLLHKNPIKLLSDITFLFSVYLIPLFAALCVDFVRSTVCDGWYVRAVCIAQPQKRALHRQRSLMMMIWLEIMYDNIITFSSSFASSLPSSVGCSPSSWTNELFFSCEQKKNTIPESELGPEREKLKRRK